LAGPAPILCRRPRDWRRSQARVSRAAAAFLDLGQAPHCDSAITLISRVFAV